MQNKAQSEVLANSKVNQAQISIIEAAKSLGDFAENNSTLTAETTVPGTIDNIFKVDERQKELLKAYWSDREANPDIYLDEKNWVDDFRTQVTYDSEAFTAGYRQTTQFIRGTVSLCDPKQLLKDIGTVVFTKDVANKIYTASTVVSPNQDGAGSAARYAAKMEAVSCMMRGINLSADKGLGYMRAAGFGAVLSSCSSNCGNAVNTIVGGQTHGNAVGAYESEKTASSGGLDDVEQIKVPKFGSQ